MGFQPPKDQDGRYRSAPPLRHRGGAGRASDFHRAAGAALLIAASLLLPGSSLQARDERVAEGAVIRDLQVENAPHDLFVSFDLTGAFSKEVREQVESGLPVTFNHYVEVLHRRPAWFDNTLIRKVISATVNYDTLTRQYRLTRAVNGEIVETTVSDKSDEMERFMTSVARLRLCDPGDLPGDRALYLRVKSRMQKRFVFFFIPWDFETSWARVRLGAPGGPLEPPR